MIDSITLQFGRSPSAPAQDIVLTPLTVFVGPNNSGKSKLLTELAQHCRAGFGDANAVILAKVGFSGLSLSEAQNAIINLSIPALQGEYIQPDHIVIGARHTRNQVPREFFLQTLQSPQHDTRLFCGQYLSHKTLWLGGAGRINLMNDQEGGDLQAPTQTSFQILFRLDDMRAEVRRIVAEAFGTYFVIDPTALGKLRVRLAPRPPIDDQEERGLHSAAVAFHSRAKHITEASDGVRAFTGIITEVIAGDPDVILIDEPEAFLHPALAAKLGLEIATAARKAGKKVLVSTHSPSFLMGCIQSNAATNIVRLTYRGNVPTARILPSDEILTLMRHPLLRSTGVLTALFYEFVIVTESDADRAFYQEVNERLLQFKPEWGIQNCLFINAQNKQTIPTIVKPLRKLGIPVVSIVDIDVLKDGGSVWSSLCAGAHIPELLQASLGSMRGAVKKAMEMSGKDMKRDGGIQILKADDNESAISLLLQMSNYGVFVVANGELESWLKGLDARGHGPNWLLDIFEKMGSDPTCKTYVKPTSNDVWQFMSKVKEWLVNPDRRGVPD